MKNDSKNRRRRKKRRAQFSTKNNIDNILTTEEPKAPNFNDDSKTITEENIHAQIQKSKNTGWGKKFKSLFGGYAGIILPFIAMFIAIGVSFVVLDYLEGTEQNNPVIVEPEPFVPEPTPPPEPIEIPTYVEEPVIEEPIIEEPVIEMEPEIIEEPEPVIIEEPEPEPQIEPEVIEEEPSSPPEEPKKKEYKFIGPPLDDGQAVVPTIQATSTTLPTLIRTQTGIKITATTGEGITHLARKAIDNQLDEKEKSLLIEQKIYAEDDLQNKTGVYLLNLGQRLEFPYNRVDSSITRAEQLRQWEIKNLNQYALRINNTNN